MYCVICQKKVNYDKKHKCYLMFCSKDCRLSELGKQIIQSKRKKTLDNKSDEDKENTKNKRKITNLKKYGVENPFQNEHIKNKYIKKRKIVLDNKSDEDKNKTIEKRKKTYKKKYGVDNPAKNKDIKLKIKKTLDNKSDEDKENTKNKRKITNLKKYGVENPAKNKDIIIKIKKINFKKYGVECLFNDPNFKKNIVKKQKEKYFDIFVDLLKNKKIIPLFTKEEYINSEYGVTEKQYFCEDCNKEFTSKVFKVQQIYCPSHNRGTSNQEKEMIEYIKSLDISVFPNKRFYYEKKKYYEIDAFLPDLNVGIEYNGLYWHCDLYKDKKYHYDKYIYCKSIGIDLIQIYDSDWLHKQDIIKSIINAKLGLISNKIFARKCQIKKIDNQTYKQFCEQNHIQGYGIAKVRIGLFYGDELIQIMSFSKPRFNKNYDWENIRTCTKLNTTVVGGFSKLMKYFTNNYTGSIITYVDCRYFNGGGYLKNGFKFIKHTEPNYFYFKKDDLFYEHRNNYQKHKLKKKLKIFDETKTEYENMLNNKYLRIFDAGNMVLTYDPN